MRGMGVPTRDLPWTGLEKENNSIPGRRGRGASIQKQEVKHRPGRIPGTCDVHRGTRVGNTTGQSSKAQQKERAEGGYGGETRMVLEAMVRSVRCSRQGKNPLETGRTTSGEDNAAYNSMKEHTGAKRISRR